MKYSKKYLDLFFSPTNAGHLKYADATAKIVNKDCGDIFKFFANYSDDNVTEVSFQAVGSVYVFAAMSVSTELVVDKSVEDLRKVTISDLKAKLPGFPESYNTILENSVAVIHKLADVIERFVEKVNKASKKKPIPARQIEQTKGLKIEKIKENKKENKKAEITPKPISKLQDKALIETIKEPVVSNQPTKGPQVIEEPKTKKSRKTKKKTDFDLIAEDCSVGFEVGQEGVDDIDSITSRLSEAVEKLKSQNN